MIKFFFDHADLIAAAIAFAAFVRPDVGRILRFFFYKITFYRSGLIEIGFSDFGPTIGIAGTLRARGANQFISRMHIELIRVRDNATYHFNWAVFRNIDYVNQNNSKIGLASAFSLSERERENL